MSFASAYNKLRPGRMSFIYKWSHPHGWFYIGKHRGHPDDGYVTGCKLLSKLIKRTSGWTREVLLICDESSAYKYEGKLIRKYRNDSNCLNRVLHTDMAWIFSPLRRDHKATHGELTYAL